MAGYGGTEPATTLGFVPALGLGPVAAELAGTPFRW